MFCPPTMLNVSGSGYTVSRSMLRFNQIDTGRRLVVVALGLAFLLLGGGALARTGTQAAEFGAVQGWLSK
jgi:hypothetical protein